MGKNEQKQCLAYIYRQWHLHGLQLGSGLPVENVVLLVYNNDLVMLASTDMKYHWCKQVFNIIISNA